MAYNISQNDTTLTKIFVGGLPYTTTDESLRKFFEQFGEIQEAVVINDRVTGKSKGYGFVTMVDASSAESACQEPNPIIDGRKANVNLAYLGAKPRGILATPALDFSAPTSPYALKTAVYPGIMQGQYAMPQYMYHPSAYMATPGGRLLTMPQHHGTFGLSPPMLSQLSPPAAGPSSTGQLAIEYTPGYSTASAGQLTVNQEAGLSGLSNINGYMSSVQAQAYAAYGAHHQAQLAQLQQHQIQEKLSQASAPTTYVIIPQKRPATPTELEVEKRLR